jgi:hypothetical protein
VYQYTYKNYKLPIGFGDFLRGCLSLIQISKIYGIECDIYIYIYKSPNTTFLKVFYTIRHLKRRFVYINP